MISKRDNKMDPFELKKEQHKLASKVELKDLVTKPKTIGGADCVVVGNKVLAAVVVLEFPSMKLLEKQTAVLYDPLPYHPGFLAYREMPAMIEAFNKLEQEPDVLLVDGSGILHPRRLGIASHLGLALNKPTIGLTKKLIDGKIENSKIYLNKELAGFEIKTKEHAKALYVSPGHLVSLGSCLRIVQQSIKLPHKLPEPLHVAHKVAKKKIKKISDTL